VPEVVEDGALEGVLTLQQFQALLTTADDQEDDAAPPALIDHDIPKFFRDTRLHLFACSEETQDFLRGPRSGEEEERVAGLCRAWVARAYEHIRNQHWR